MGITFDLLNYALIGSSVILVALALPLPRILKAIFVNLAELNMTFGRV